MALSRTHFIEAAKYGVWYEPSLLWGSEIETGGASMIPADREAVMRQCALEYLLENFIDMTVQLAYGVIKLRATVQHIKAIRLDLRMLGISGGRLHEMTQELLGWLDGWFERPRGEKVLSTWMSAFYDELRLVLSTQLQEAPLFVPKESRTDYARKIRLAKSPKLDFRFAGFTLPAVLLGAHKKLFNLNTRLNSFTFDVPQSESAARPVLEERSALYGAIKKSVTTAYPHFQPHIPGFCNRIME
ncbi:MAG: hypothetical protein WAU81_01010 [Candidatus Aminicenantales bacterium]